LQTIVDADISSIGAPGSAMYEAFTATYLSGLAAYLSISADRLYMLGVVPASVDASLYIVDTEASAGEKSAAAAAAQLVQDSAAGDLTIAGYTVTGVRLINPPAPPLPPAAPPSSPAASGLSGGAIAAIIICLLLLAVAAGISIRMCNSRVDLCALPVAAPPPPVGDAPTSTQQDGRPTAGPDRPRGYTERFEVIDVKKEGSLKVSYKTEVAFAPPAGGGSSSSTIWMRLPENM